MNYLQRTIRSLLPMFGVALLVNCSSDVPSPPKSSGNYNGNTQDCNAAVQGPGSGSSAYNPNASNSSTYNPNGAPAADPYATNGQAPVYLQNADTQITQQQTDNNINNSGGVTAYNAPAPTTGANNGTYTPPTSNCNASQWAPTTPNGTTLDQRPAAPVTQLKGAAIGTSALKKMVDECITTGVNLSGGGFFDREAYAQAAEAEKSTMENFCRAQDLYQLACDMTQIGEFYKSEGYTVDSSVPDGYLVDQCIVCEDGATTSQCSYYGTPSGKQLFVHFAPKTGNVPAPPFVGVLEEVAE